MGSRWTGLAVATAVAVLGVGAIVVGLVTHEDGLSVPASAVAGTVDPAAASTGGPGTDGGTPPGPSPASSPSPAPPDRPTDRPGATRPGTRPPVVDHGPRGGDLVALTFDADMTEGMRYSLRSGEVRSYANLAIVELLEREQVPATFFLTGMWVEEYPDLTRRLAGNPRFELANHTYDHSAFTADCYGLPQLPANAMTADVAKTFEVIEPYGGRQTRYFRFPGLCHDGAALAALAPLGVTVVDGDVISGDPFATAWQPIVDAVLSRVQPGSVVVLHVTEANAAMTDEALPHILAGLRDRGLTPATLSEVLAG
ncbi:polysaccharide deacetylase family protein [Solwaraspora sp. WMMD406]|uniref:polysaccharide deacetylase family protein n=1 Tax=Solwaraspora sp. WMMD406 TaxID=3016095 RepID=UPI00241773FB|nr:polysaccharide deacetylase family protein [Solwaraspora sp. WMMD406]MDG4764254.1 polysaccharide deacetylase family protein [Solwaraspora sp. WMMD406]